jgi:hypothetical protein
MQENKISVTKMSGERALFDEQKLRQSLIGSGAGQAESDAIIQQVRAKLYEGIKTNIIYKIAFSLLSKKQRPAASRYKLKKAIFELGPTGFPFEKYIGELLKSTGYKITVGSFVQGHCVKHEVDIIAEKDDQHIILEFKFHSEQGQICSVKIPLYIHSRFKDIEMVLKEQPAFEKKILSGGLVTNTRFSADALQYGTCMNMFMLSWDYPVNNGLKNRIDKLQLYPITALMTLTNYEKKMLLNKGIILCKDLPQNEALLKDLDFSTIRIAKVMSEALALCVPVG